MTDQNVKWAKEERQSGTVLKAVVTFSMVLVGLYFVVSLGNAVFSDSLASPINITLSESDIGDALPPKAILVDATASIDPPIALGYRLAWWLVTDAPSVLAIAGLELLRRILASGAAMFSSINVRRFHVLAALAVGYVLTEAIRGVVAFEIQYQLGVNEPTVTWGMAPLVLALVFVVLAGVLRQGATLRADQELTI